jgi:glyceraldehyde-3-phosphate dehydrogenase (NADP+)
MNAIPEEFQIKTLLNQDTYLVDGELKNGKVKHQRCSQRFHQRRIRTNNIGSIPFMGKEGLEAVDAADAAFNNGQGMAHHESGRSNCMTRFVTQMEATEEVVKYLMWEIGNHYLIPKRI